MPPPSSDRSGEVMMADLISPPPDDPNRFERIMSQCLDAMPEIVLIVNRDGRSVFWNRAAHDYFGPRVAQARWPHERDALFHPDDRAARHAARHRALREGVALTLPLRAMRFDHTMHQHDFVVTPLYDSVARTVALLVISTPADDPEDRGFH